MSAYNALGLVGLYQELRETVRQVRPEGPKQVVLAVFANACWWAGTNVRRLGREADTFLCDLGTAAELKLRANRRVRWDTHMRTKYGLDLNLTKALRSVYFGKWVRLKNENGKPIWGRAQAGARATMRSGRECMMGWPSESGTLGADAEIDSHGNFIVRRRIGTGISALDTWDPRDENWVILCRGNAHDPASAKTAVEAAATLGGALRALAEHFALGLAYARLAREVERDKAISEKLRLEIARLRRGNRRLRAQTAAVEQRNQKTKARIAAMDFEAATFAGKRVGSA